MSNSFNTTEVLSFDCYGTLIDWETGLHAAYQPLLAAQADAAPSRAALLEAHARVEPVIESETPAARYETILARTHAAVAAEFSFETTPALDEAFGASIPQWPAFPDSGAALARLATRFKLVILSNVSTAGIAASIERLGAVFDAVYTAEAIGSYKPDDANFAYLLANVRADFGVRREGLVHVAQSLYHDHVPAKRHGLTNVWIDRQDLAGGGSSGATATVDVMPAIDHRFPDLASFADAAVPGPA